MKKGLVMEGGAMRGMFTAGVTDVFMENGVAFDGAVGVSAGAVFGCNYKSHQPGRAVRYNKRFCRDPRYAGLRTLIRTGDIYGADFCYRQIPEDLDPFDKETFAASPMEFYVVCTDMDTGEAVYHRCERGEGEDVQWMRASASMPLVSRVVEIGGRRLSDGGTADSIPLRFFEGAGYDRNVVILTQPEGFMKERNKHLALIRLALKRYPAFIRALETRHERYNETLQYIRERERTGGLLVIRPQAPLGVGAVVHDPQELERVYRLGRAEGERRLRETAAFLSQTPHL